MLLNELSNKLILKDNKLISLGTDIFLTILMQ
jgi:hypothetical protein